MGEYVGGKALHGLEVFGLGLTKVGAQDDLIDAGLRVLGEAVDHLLGLTDDEVLFQFLDALGAGQSLDVALWTIPGQVNTLSNRL